MQTRDYLERMIRQIAEFVARIAGFTAEGKFEEAERELDGAWNSGLGFRRRDALRLDDATLAAMLGPKAKYAAELFEAEAGIARAQGDDERAALLDERARLLRR